MTTRILNPFSDNPAWEQTQLTDDINRRPVPPNLISDDLDWVEKGVYQKTVMIDVKDGAGLDIIDDAPYNGVPQQLSVPDGDPVLLYVPSHPAQSTVNAEEVSARRAFGTEEDTETVEARKNEHLDVHVTDHSLSHETDRIGAIFGNILRRDGSVKVALADKFGKSPQALDFDFEDADEDIVNFYLKAKDILQEAAPDLPTTQFNVYTASDMFNKVVNNKQLLEKWKYFNTGMPFVDKRNGFEVCDGVFVKQYSRNVVIPNSGGRRIFPTDKMAMVPVAAGNYQTRWAPRQDLVYVNSEGIAMYVKTKILDGDVGLQINSESNHIHWVKRPEGTGIITQSA